MDEGGCVIDAYGSHLPVLIRLVAMTRGAVLEIGTGHYSTPMLHALCCPGRELVSVETDFSWVSEFRDFHRDGHRFEFCDASDLLAHLDRLSRRAWSVVFVDHSPWEERGLSAALFAHSAEYVIAHDFSLPHIGQLFESVSGEFRNVQVYERYSPSTLVLSQKEIPELG